MKLLILYRPRSEFATAVEDFAREIDRRHNIGNKLEMLSVDTRDGSATASLYDVMSYPAILALADDGSVINMWTGMPLPLMSDVIGHVFS